MQSATLVCSVLGVCAGLLLGNLTIRYSLPDLEYLSARATVAGKSGEPRLIEVRGVLREYNATADTIIVDILSPYAGRTTIPIEARIDDKTNLTHNLEYFGTEAGLIVSYDEVRAQKSELTHGRKVYLLLRASEESFSAVIVRLVV